MTRITTETKNGKSGETFLPMKEMTAAQRKDIDIQWLADMVKRSQVRGIQHEIHRMTPKLAEFLLDDERNPMNRNIAARTVERYARDIENGHWRFNGEPIIISENGMLNDGQHRAAAVVKAGQTVDFLFVIGASRSSRTTLDQGQARTAGHYLKMEGAQYSTNAAAIARTILKIKYNSVSGGRYTPTNAEVLEFVHENPEVFDSCSAIPLKPARKVGGHTVLSTAHFMISRVAEPETVDEFFEKLVSGSDLSARHAILICRNKLFDLVMERAKPWHKLECVLRGWNNFRTGSRRRAINLQGEFPEIEA